MMNLATTEINHVFGGANRGYSEVPSTGNYIEAEKTLKTLKELGLDVLNLSIDDYHSEYIPINRVKKIVRD